MNPKLFPMYLKPQQHRAFEDAQQAIAMMGEHQERLYAIDQATKLRGEVISVTSDQYLCLKSEA